MGFNSVFKGLIQCGEVFLSITSSTSFVFKSLDVATRTAANFNITNSRFCPFSVYVIRMYLRKKQRVLPRTASVIGFYNREDTCLPRGTDWGFK